MANTKQHGAYDTEPDHPQQWPAYSVEETGRMLWHSPEGERAKHGVMPCWDRDAIVADIAALEASAARYLARHPAPPIEWDHPEFALFPPAQGLVAA